MRLAPSGRRFRSGESGLGTEGGLPTEYGNRNTGFVTADRSMQHAGVICSPEDAWRLHAEAAVRSLHSFIFYSGVMFNTRGSQQVDDCAPASAKTVKPSHLQPFVIVPGGDYFFSDRTESTSPTPTCRPSPTVPTPGNPFPAAV
ncbi:hypothetical protein VTN96DRAFT_4102 [Rasamsonia emersonii]